jgi:hypothetical protein
LRVDVPFVRLIIFIQDAVFLVFLSTLAGVGASRLRSR